MDAQTRNPIVATSALIDKPIKPAEYSRIITRILLELAEAKNLGADIQTIPIFDESRCHYQLLDIGWDNAGRRVSQPVIHVDLIDGKVWIQENVTDSDIAQIFVLEGIERSHIVLGLHSRSHRELSDYAID